MNLFLALWLMVASFTLGAFLATQESKRKGRLATRRLRVVMGFDEHHPHDRYRVRVGDLDLTAIAERVGGTSWSEPRSINDPATVHVVFRKVPEGGPVASPPCEYPDCWCRNAASE